MTKSADITKLIPADQRGEVENAAVVEPPLAEEVNAPDRPGIYQIPDTVYHEGPGISRSELWTMHDKTPYHYRYGERKETEALKFGKAIHTAVLEPNIFEAQFYRGPEDRRGKKWETALEVAAQNGKTCITEGEFIDAEKIRDVAHRNALVRKLTSGKPSIEQSAYAIDEATGELVKVRLDIVNHDIRIAADLKSCANGSARHFQKSVADYGYHIQDYLYPKIWEDAGGTPLDGFVFLCIEKTAPWAISVYELDDPVRDEARAIYRTSLDNISGCWKQEREMRRANEATKNSGKKGLSDSELNRAVAAACWPSYPTTVQRIDLPAYGYRMTKR